MQIDTKRYRAQMGLRPTLAADVLAPAVPTAAQGAQLPSRFPPNPMQPPCEHQGARSAARTAFLARKIAPKHDGAVATLETCDRVFTMHAAVLRAVLTAVPRLKESFTVEQQSRLTEAFLWPLWPRLSAFRAFAPPAIEPPGPPGFADRRPPARC
jgi:hypothetical protein